MEKQEIIKNTVNEISINVLKQYKKIGIHNQSSGITTKTLINMLFKCLGGNPVGKAHNTLSVAW